jgi:16S rRNA (cytosine1402-N4)-methyltransferase
MKHSPVLLNEVITALEPQSGSRYIDATLGDGGHANALLEASQPDGKVLGLDQDPQQIMVAKENLAKWGKRITIVESRFSSLKERAVKAGFRHVDGILLDLGISSRQLSVLSYGLSLDDNSNLDMRLTPTLPHSAADLLNHGNETEIADILYEFGDRHNSRTLARKIVSFRRKATFKVAYDLKQAIDVWNPHALAPIFQALRIWVNTEFDELHTVLPQAIDLLTPGGTLAIITFHSGEDRIVKRFLRDRRKLLRVSHVITPSYDEVRKNPRARSAKLRLAQKLGGEQHDSS